MPDSGLKNQKRKVSLIELENMMEKEDGGHDEVMCNILKICTGHIEKGMYKDQKYKDYIEIVLNWKEWTETKQIRTRKFHLSRKMERKEKKEEVKENVPHPKKVR